MSTRKMKDKRRQQIKEQKRAERLREKSKPITFACLECGEKEDIPKDVVDTFDTFDDGDLSVPPRFDCEICGGIMEPIEYTSAHGITYRLEEQA